MVESLCAFDVIMITKVTISRLTINAGIVIALTITPIGSADKEFFSTKNNEKAARRRLSFTSSTQLVAAPASRPSRQDRNRRLPARHYADLPRGVFAWCTGDSSVRGYARSSKVEGDYDREVCRPGSGLSEC